MLMISHSMGVTPYAEGKIEGQVIDVETNDPVPAATVNVREGVKSLGDDTVKSMRQTTADSEGVL